MSKLAIFGLVTLVTVASAQCDWGLVDQAACQASNTQQDCFPPGWPTCGGAANGAGGAGGDGGQTIADILPASCNEVDFLKCLYEYPDLENYLTCVHPEPCSCAGDFKVLECADAHCTDKSEYPEVLTSNIAECRAKELTSTTSTTTQVVVATTRSVDDKGVSTSTELVPSTTVTAYTTTTSTVVSTGAAAVMNMEMGIGAMAAAAMGFAALL